MIFFFKSWLGFKDTKNIKKLLVIGLEINVGWHFSKSDKCEVKIQTR